jgi:hypothetical protein
MSVMDKFFAAAARARLTPRERAILLASPLGDPTSKSTPWIHQAGLALKCNVSLRAVNRVFTKARRAGVIARLYASGPGKSATWTWSFDGQVSPQTYVPGAFSQPKEAPGSVTMKKATVVPKSAAWKTWLAARAAKATPVSTRRAPAPAVRRPRFGMRSQPEGAAPPRPAPRLVLTQEEIIANMRRLGEEAKKRRLAQ